MYYAEKETDKYIRETFFINKNDGIMVEVGAGPPEFFSMSKCFREIGWRCICVEPNPIFVKQHKELGNEIYEFACSNEEIESSSFNVFERVDNSGMMSYSALDIKYPMKKEIEEKFIIHEINVKVIKLDSLLEKLNIKEIDFLSVDTEGWELEVMKGFDIIHYNPKIVLLENYLYKESYVEYMNNKGYKLVHQISHNFIFEKTNYNI